MKNLKIVLGSASPRRQFLLREFGINFRIIKSDIPEIPPPALQGAEIAKYISKLKSDDLFPQISNDELLITADTIVWINGEMLGKPNDEEQAVSMLKKLSGQTHTVFTGITLRSSETDITFSAETNVSFKNVSDQKIKEYVHHFKPYDKAGAYGAQECLAESMNPCSGEEMNALRTINKEDLFFHTLVDSKLTPIPMIKEINGSYFNVMGLPIVQLMQKLSEIN